MLFQNAFSQKRKRNDDFAASNAFFLVVIMHKYSKLFCAFSSISYYYISIISQFFNFVNVQHYPM